MVDVKQAIKVAADYVREIFSDNGAGAIRDIRLEEVSTDPSGWHVTVSFHRDGATATIRVGDASFPGHSPRVAVGVDPSREYRVVNVSKDGVAKGVKIRPLVLG